MTKATGTKELHSRGSRLTRSLLTSLLLLNLAFVFLQLKILQPQPGEQDLDDYPRTFKSTGKFDVALGTSLWWPPSASIFRIMGPLETAIVVIFVDYDHLDFADNLATSITKAVQPLAEYKSSYPFVLVPTDKPTYHVLLHAYPDNVIPPPPDDWGAPTKAWMLNMFLYKEINVLYNTVEGVWLSDILTDTTRQSKAVDMLLVPVNDKVMSTAMMYLKHSEVNHAFLDYWHQNITDGKSSDPHDEVSFNKALANALTNGLKTKVLERNYYVSTIDDFVADQISKAGMVCNRMNVTKQQKIRQFERLHLWNPSGKLENKNNQDQSPKTLVILLGGLRGGEPTWNSLYQHMLKPNNADLALMLGQSNHTSSLYQHARYQWEFPEYDDWNQAFDDFFPEKVHSQWKENLGGNRADSAFGSNSSGAILGFARALLSAQLEKEGLLEKYKWFVVTRPDQYYNCDVNLALFDPNKVWIPTGEDWGGICDRFLATGKKWIQKAINTHLPATQNPLNYTLHFANNEAFIAHRWLEEGVLDHIKRFRRVMFTAYAKGDATRFAAEGMKNAFVEDGLLIQYKYEDEYYQASSCGSIGGAVDPLDPMLVNDFHS